MPHCLSGSSILHNTTTRNQKKLKNKLYLETLWVGPHPENQKKTKNKYLETLWGEPHPENQKRKEPWKNKKQYLETLGWTYMCFLLFFRSFWRFIFSEPWLDSLIPKTTYEICFCSILLFQSWYRLAFILSFATHHAHHCPTLKTQHQLQSICCITGTDTSILTASLRRSLCQQPPSFSVLGLASFAVMANIDVNFIDSFRHALGECDGVLSSEVACSHTQCLKLAGPQVQPFKSDRP